MLEIHVIIRTDKDNPLSEREASLIRALGAEDGAPAGTVSVQAESAKVRENLAAATPTQKPAPKAAAKKPAPEPEPEPEPEPTPEPEEEDLVGAGPTLDDAVAKATELVAAGKAAQVKAALGAVGVKRVAELKGDAIAAFLGAL